MADITIGSATSLQFAVDARQALTTVGATRVPAGTPATAVPDALAAKRSGGGVPLTVADARTAVGVAFIAGLGILDALESLADAFRLAADFGLVSSNTRLSLGGTRISGVNITAQGNLLVDAIDDLVKTATTSGANLISSTALRTTIQTTQFGGRITVSPQALDSAGLGIKDLDGTTVEAAAASLARIETALNLARTRVDNLEVLRDGLVPGGGVSREIIRLVNSGSSAFLPRGSLINEIA